MVTMEENVRYSGEGVTLEIEDRLAWIRLDQPDRPVNVLSSSLIQSFGQVLSQLESSDARAAIIISDKPNVWIAGADIEEFGTLRTASAFYLSGHRDTADINGFP